MEGEACLAPTPAFRSLLEHEAGSAVARHGEGTGDAPKEDGKEAATLMSV